MKLKILLLAASMLLSVALSISLTPKQLYAKDHKPDVTLEQLIPPKFGSWRIDPASEHFVISPSEAAHLAMYYTDTLSRTYINSAGDRIMLSLAYGADQGRSLQVHKPEVCYEAQGFKITYSARGDTALSGREVPNMRLIATAGSRIEPITYWIRTGDYLARGWLEQNLARVKNGVIKGHIPDGLLVRVSTIDDNKEHAYAVQDAFLKELLDASSPQARTMLLGEEQYAKQ